ncbi:MFS general substrate transporter [Mrakia frigida]|uniref:MFS general substrate transporter n=1 Tax=Mrakia frigida TaxID=29902 RepID=UPI003FCC02D1
MTDHKNSVDLELEKQEVQHTEAGGVQDVVFSDRPALEKRLLRKIDARMSILIIIYILNYIDRNNLSAARTKGLEVDLALKGQEYPTLLSILYVGYILMQIPSNIIVQSTGRPSRFLPLCMAVWGVISILTGITHNFVGALLTRFFLGFVEAAFFPGAILLISNWYKKDEIALRTCTLFCGSLISNAFGPLIAAGILGGMEGKLDQPAWRWLFYVEGAITVAVAIVAFWILPDFPHNSRGFTTEEKALAVLRMTEDAGEPDSTDGEAANGILHGLKLAATDYKVYVLSMALTCMVIGLSFNQFFPQLTTTLGYNNTNTLLLCAPPFVFATIMAFIVARSSDKRQERTLHIIVPLCFGIVGFIIAMSTNVVAARYVSLFLMAQSYSSFVCLYAWISSSFPRPAFKRAIAIAGVNAFSQFGNISGAYIYQSSWAPTYIKSFGISIAMFVASITLVLVHRWTLQKANERIIKAEACLDGSIVRTADAKVPYGFRYVL